MIVGILILLALYVIYLFNRFIRVRNRVDNAWSQIDVQLRRRYDLIPNLVEVVKGYATHERELFEEVTRARTRGMEASSVDAQASAENQLTHGVRQLLAVAEQYPDLKANQNFLALQEELTATESKIAYARQFYNDEVMRLNTLTQSFPSNVIAGTFRFTQRPFFEIDEPERGPVQVEL